MAVSAFVKNDRLDALLLKAQDKLDAISGLENNGVGNIHLINRLMDEVAELIAEIEAFGDWVASRKIKARWRSKLSF